MREAIEAVLGQLEVPIGGTLSGMVRQAREQLEQPATGSLKEQIAVACAQVEVETGWHVEVPQEPTPMTASAAHELAQLCQSPPVSDTNQFPPVQVHSQCSLDELRLTAAAKKTGRREDGTSATILNRFGSDTVVFFKVAPLKKKVCPSLRPQCGHTMLHTKKAQHAAELQ